MVGCVLAAHDKLTGRGCGAPAYAPVNPAAPVQVERVQESWPFDMKREFGLAEDGDAEEEEEEE